MDFKQLSKVSDSLFGAPGNQTVQIPDDVQIQEETSPLDNIQVDKKKIKDTKPHDKVLILDDVQIKSIMESSRDKRRQILSKLSDSQRKRVLTRYAQLKKIQDETEEVKVSKLDLINLDNLASNYLFSPNNYNKKLFQESLDYIGVLLPEDFQSLFTSLLEDGVANPENKDKVQEWVNYLAEQGLESSLSSVFDLLENPIDDDVDPLENNDTEELTYSESDLLDENSTVLEDSIQKKYGFSLKQLIDSRISDEYVEAALDKIEEKPFIDEEGNEVVPVEERPVLELLAEALDEYQKGNPEKLESLAQQPVDEEKEPEDGDEVESESAEGGLIDISEDITVEDSVKLANAIISKDYKVCDSFKGFHPVLDSFFDEFIDHVDDVDTEPEDTNVYGLESSEFNPAQTVVDVPLTRDEFCTIATIPPAFKALCKECPTEVPTVETWSCNNPCLVVNETEGYFPYACTLEELKQQLETPGADLQKIIGSTCVSVKDACKIAAKTDSLNIIDNKFYKKSMFSPVWHYDNLPTVLKTCGVTKPTGTIQIADYDNGQDDIYDLFGVKYKVK